jgi:cyanophycinase
LAGGVEALVGIIPAAAAPDGNDRRAGQNGQRWFRGLGAKHVTVLEVVDQASANHPVLADALAHCRLIYMLGGFPHYLAQTLAGSRAWQAVVSAYQAGAVVGGSSAGAMVLCEYYFNPETKTAEPGLNLVAGACLIPHYDTLGGRWIAALETALPHISLIGIDEQTGIVSDETGGQWSVYGKGQITLHRPAAQAVYLPGEKFSFP